MAKTKGRKNKYESHVKPRFNEIEKWLELGATEKEIYKNLKISKDTWIKYKTENPELIDLLKKGREKPVEEIKAAMLKRAKGFQYEEKKVTVQHIEIDYDGSEIKTPAKVIREEITTKTALPDVAAGLVLLKHWDKDENGKAKWTGDPASLEIKQKELELKEKQAENDSW